MRLNKQFISRVAAAFLIAKDLITPAVAQTSNNTGMKLGVLTRCEIGFVRDLYDMADQAREKNDNGRFSAAARALNAFAYRNYEIDRAARDIAEQAASLPLSKACREHLLEIVVKFPTRYDA